MFWTTQPHREVETSFQVTSPEKVGPPRVIRLILASESLSQTSLRSERIGAQIEALGPVFFGESGRSAKITLRVWAPPGFPRGWWHPHRDVEVTRGSGRSPFRRPHPSPSRPSLADSALRTTMQRLVPIREAFPPKWWGAMGALWATRKDQGVRNAEGYVARAFRTRVARASGIMATGRGRKDADGRTQTQGPLREDEDSGGGSARGTTRASRAPRVRTRGRQRRNVERARTRTRRERGLKRAGEDENDESARRASGTRTRSTKGQDNDQDTRTRTTRASGKPRWSCRWF